MYYSMYIVNTIHWFTLNKQYLIKAINVSSCHFFFPIIQCFLTRILKIMNQQETKRILFLSSWRFRPKLFFTIIYSLSLQNIPPLYILLCPIQCSSHHHPHHHSVCFCIFFSNRVTTEMLQASLCGLMIPSCQEPCL